MSGVVYRYFDAAGALLFVGRTRFTKSTSGYTWLGEICRVEKANYPDKSSAIRVIAEAITSERPKYNKYIPTPPDERPSKEDHPQKEMSERARSCSQENDPRGYKNPFPLSDLESDAVGYMPSDFPLHAEVDWKQIDAMLYEARANDVARRHDDRGTFGYGSARDEWFKQRDPWV